MAKGERLQVEIRRDDARVIVKLAGDLDHGTANLMRDKVVGAVSAAPLAWLVLDMGLVEFCDSSGLRALVLSWKATREAGARITLVAVNDRCRTLLDRTGLIPFLDVRDNLPAAGS
jgi:anti-anti-sigma factor